MFPLIVNPRLNTLHLNGLDDLDTTLLSAKLKNTCTERAHALGCNASPVTKAICLRWRFSHQLPLRTVIFFNSERSIIPTRYLDHHVQSVHCIFWPPDRSRSQNHNSRVSNKSLFSSSQRITEELSLHHIFSTALLFDSHDVRKGVEKVILPLPRAKYHQTVASCNTIV